MGSKRTRHCSKRVEDVGPGGGVTNLSWARWVDYPVRRDINIGITSYDPPYGVVMATDRQHIWRRFTESQFWEMLHWYFILYLSRDHVLTMLHLAPIFFGGKLAFWRGSFYPSNTLDRTLRNINIGITSSWDPPSGVVMAIYRQHIWSRFTEWTESSFSFIISPLIWLSLKSALPDHENSSSAAIIFSVKLRSWADIKWAKGRSVKMKHNANIVDYLSAMKMKLIKITEWF